jgi:hypothetical protein
MAMKFFEKKDDPKKVDSLLNLAKQEKMDIEAKTIRHLTDNDFYKLALEKQEEYMLSDEGLKLVEFLAKKNFTLVKIAYVFAKTQKWLSDLQSANPQFYDAMKLGYNDRDTEIEDALFKMANGYYVTEERTTVKEINPERSYKETQSSQRYIPGNYYAAQYLINNRRELEYKKDTDTARLANGSTLKIIFELPQDVEGE